MNLTHFDEHFYTINYSKNIAPILEYLSYFSVLLSAKTEFISMIILASITDFFSKIKKFYKYYEGEKLMASF